MSSHRNRDLVELGFCRLLNIQTKDHLAALSSNEPCSYETEVFNVIVLLESRLDKPLLTSGVHKFVNAIRDCPTKRN